MRCDAAPVRVRLLVVVRTRDGLATMIAASPADHGSADLRSEVFFLKHPLTADVVYAGLPELREGVDSVFQQMIVRTWRTTTRLSEMLGAS